MSQFYTEKIIIFIERIDLIIEKGFKNILYFNSYIIDRQQCLLFISLSKKNYDYDIIRFISNMFMCKFKINEVLVVTNCAISNTEYDKEKVHMKKF